MKTRLAGLFAIALAVTAFTCIKPAQADNYGNYLSSGIASNSNYGGGNYGRGNSCGGGGGGGGRGEHHHHFDQDQANMQTGIYPNSNSPFASTNAYANYGGNNYGAYNGAYGNNYGNANNYGNSGFLNQQAALQQQLASGNLSMRDRIKLQTRLAKLEARAYNQGQGGLTPFANNYGGGGLLSNFRNQYLNNNNNLASNGGLSGIRGMLGF